LVIDLQRFYTDNRIDYHFKASEYQGLYKVLYLSLEHSKCEEKFSYFIGKLSREFSDLKNIAELKNFLYEKSNKKIDSLYNFNLIDGVMRCLLTCVKHCESHLNKHDVETIAPLLKPFWAKMHHANLLKRQINRISVQY
jgi:hypothetical protein